MRYTYERQDDEEYPFLTNTGKLFDDEREVRLYCEMWNRHEDAFDKLGEVPAHLARADYERFCRLAGIIPLDDAEIWGPSSYAITNGEFYPWIADGKIAGYTPEQCVAMWLALRRLLGIQDERDAQPKPNPPIQKPPEPQLILCSCGHWVERGLVMSASLGTSCHYCYDRMSDGC